MFAQSVTCGSMSEHHEMCVYMCLFQGPLRSITASQLRPLHVLHVSGTMYASCNTKPYVLSDLPWSTHTYAHACKHARTHFINIYSLQLAQERTAHPRMHILPVAYVHKHAVCALDMATRKLCVIGTVQRTSCGFRTRVQYKHTCMNKSCEKFHINYKKSTWVNLNMWTLNLIHVKIWFQMWNLSSMWKQPHVKCQMSLFCCCKGPVVYV